MRESRAALKGEPIKLGLIAGILLAIPAALGEPAVRIALALLWAALVAAVVRLLARDPANARRLVARLARGSDETGR